MREGSPEKSAKQKKKKEDNGAHSFYLDRGKSALREIMRQEGKQHKRSEKERRRLE